MNKEMYEVNYHYNGDNSFSCCSISKITVIRQGILPGCSLPSITAIDENWRKFQGSSENYFNTKEEALNSILAFLKESIARKEGKLIKLKNEIKNLQAYKISCHKIKGIK